MKTKPKSPAVRSREEQKDANERLQYAEQVMRAARVNLSLAQRAHDGAAQALYGAFREARGNVRFSVLDKYTRSFGLAINLSENQYVSLTQRPSPQGRKR